MSFYIRSNSCKWNAANQMKDIRSYYNSKWMHVEETFQNLIHLETTTQGRIGVCLPAGRAAGHGHHAHVHVWLESTGSNRHQGTRWRLLSVWCSSACVCRCKLTGLYVGEGQCCVVCLWLDGRPSGVQAPVEQPLLGFGYYLSNIFFIWQTQSVKETEIYKRIKLGKIEHDVNPRQSHRTLDSLATAWLF